MGIKYAVDENFFKTWTPTMAYVLGFMYADGSMYKSVRGHYFLITSTDEEMVVRVKKWLKSKHSIFKEIPGGRRKPRFTLKIGNKAMYQDLLQLGLYPNKSLTIRMPVVPESMLGHFTRGCLDGDGCVFLERGKGITQEVITKKTFSHFYKRQQTFPGGPACHPKKTTMAQAG